MQKVVKMIKKIEKLVFFWDSTIKPWSVEVQGILDYLARVGKKGLTCELIDTKDLPDGELEYWRKEALAVSLRWHQQIRQYFGASQLHLGKQVPALLVYEGGGKLPTAVYPHSEKRGHKHTNFSIEDFLKELTHSLGG